MKGTLTPEVPVVTKFEVQYYVLPYYERLWFAGLTPARVPPATGDVLHHVASDTAYKVFTVSHSKQTFMARPIVYVYVKEVLAEEVK